MTTLTITRCARVADVPDELAEAFKHMPHYMNTDDRRDSYESMDTAWDPLSTEGYNRDALYLTGFVLAGHQPDGRPVYLLRFNNNAFAAYVLNGTMYRPGSKNSAQDKCVELIAGTGLWSLTDGRIVRVERTPEPEAVEDERTWPETTEEHRAFAAWQSEVANGDTLRGFRDWIAAQDNDASDAAA